MNNHDKVALKRLPSGVPGLDAIMDGGIPEFSFNIIAGSPGCGKTTFAHQFMFENATVESPALYITVLGEPAIKMLRYQQQYSFFDAEKMNTAIKFINLSEIILEKKWDAILAEIVRMVEEVKPAIVVVDSFRTVERKPSDSQLELSFFIQRLALHLASWQATTFLLGEYVEAEMRDNPVFTVADGLIWLYQVAERNSVVRKLQIVKMRGVGSVPGMHTFRITDDGLQAFSRTLGLTRRKEIVRGQRLISTGIVELDKMMNGGIPEGDSVLIAGSSGTGKSLIATQFINEGLKLGEKCIIAVFEERPTDYTARAMSFGLDFKTPQEDGRLTIIYLRPLDLSVDETLQELLAAVEKIDAKRLVIDSIAGFEMALAPGFRTDFRESLYRMIASLTGSGVTVLSTVEVKESMQSLDFSQYAISFLTDDIIRLRFVEIDAQLRRILMVLKMRGNNHSKDIREYEITEEGLIVGERLTGYRGLITGVPVPIERN